MIKLRTAPEKHFSQVEYAGSELLIFKYNSARKRLLLCCDDLSEKIPEWVSGRKTVEYAVRYKIFRFQDIADFQRSDVNTDDYPTIANDLFSSRDNRVVLIDDITVHKAQRSYEFSLSFERGFGVATFVCKQVSIYELPFYLDTQPEGKSRYYTDPTTKADFDEGEFLVHLYEEG